MTKDSNIRHRKPEDKESENSDKAKGSEISATRRKLNKFNENDLLRKATGSVKHRIWTRSVVILSVMIIVYFYTKDKKEVKFALQKENIILRSQRFPCSAKYLTEINNFPRCAPKSSSCGRFVTDSLVTAQQVEILLDIARKGFQFGQSDGGASILDLHSGALSKGTKFVNFYGEPGMKEWFKTEHLVTYKMVKATIKIAIGERFEIDPDSLHLTYPTFFSRITNETAKTIHDEYWHPHVDKETYESFHYTSLLYLSDYNRDFKGGRFLFTDGEETNKTISAIEPKKGRLSAFTSGAENVHNVEKVEEGERYAITISFTCNKKFAISDPKMGVAGN